jgi:hypothetical protein
VVRRAGTARAPALFGVEARLRETYQVMRQDQKAAIRFKGADFDAEAYPFPNRDFRISIPYPKMSFTLSKIEEPRSAGLFSTLSVAPSCSISLRCSRVSFVGVSTRT